MPEGIDPKIDDLAYRMYLSHMAVYYSNAKGTLVPAGTTRQDVAQFAEQVRKDGGLAHAAHPDFYAPSDWLA